MLMSAAEIIRASDIGASQIPAVCGVSPFADAWTVVASKKGLREPEPETEEQRWGKILESIIAGVFQRVLAIIVLPVALLIFTFMGPAVSRLFAQSTELQSAAVYGAPAMSNLEAVPSATSIAVTWTTSSPSNSSVRCRTTNGSYIDAVDNGTQTDVTSHSGIVAGLTPLTTYYCQVQSRTPIARVMISYFTTTTTPQGTADISRHHRPPIQTGSTNAEASDSVAIMPRGLQSRTRRRQTEKRAQGSRSLLGPASSRHPYHTQTELPAGVKR